MPSIEKITEKDVGEKALFRKWFAGPEGTSQITGTILKCYTQAGQEKVDISLPLGGKHTLELKDWNAYEILKR